MELGARRGSRQAQYTLCACPCVGRSAGPCSQYRFPAWISPLGLSEGRGCLQIRKQLQQPQPLVHQHLVSGPLV